MLSRKNYVAFAGILAGDYASSDREGKLALFRATLSLADYFAGDNPRFDRQRFYAAVFGSSDLDRVREDFTPPALRAVASS